MVKRNSMSKVIFSIPLVIAKTSALVIDHSNIRCLSMFKLKFPCHIKLKL